MKIRIPVIRPRTGFSLAEVTIASGITAVALSTLLGLIPEGLNNIKEAGNLAAETRITGHILGAISQAKWQNGQGEDILAPAFDRQRYYFDDQGIAIEAEEPDPHLAYVAEVQVPTRDVALPADAAPAEEESAFDPYLRRVTVKVASVANERFDFDRALPIVYRSHTTIIARNGK